MIFGSYIAGACRGDTLKGKLWSVRYFFDYPGKWLWQLIMGQSIGLAVCRQCSSSSFALDVTLPQTTATAFSTVVNSFIIIWWLSRYSDNYISCIFTARQYNPQTIDSFCCFLCPFNILIATRRWHILLEARHVATLASLGLGFLWRESPMGVLDLVLRPNGFCQMELD